MSCNGSFYFILFLFISFLFVNGGNLDEPQGGIEVSSIGAALKGTFLGVISLRDIYLHHSFLGKKSYIRG